MPRSKKPKIALVNPEVSDSAPAYPVVTFNDRSFEIHPMSDRDDDAVYDDAAEFLILGIPVGSKVYSELLRVTNDNPAALDRLENTKLETEKEQVAFAMDLMDIVTKSNIEHLLQDLRDTLPQLAALACHYTDPTVTARDIRKWSKSPINGQLWRAVIEQFKADNLMGQLGALTAVAGEFVRS